MKSENMTVYKSNKLIEASYGALTLNEQLMLLACIASKNPDELTTETGIILTVSSFADLAEINPKGAYDDLQRAAERIFNRYLVIDSPDPDNPRLRKTRTRWIYSIDYYPGEGAVCLYFSPKVLPYISQLSGQFTKYKLKYVSKFNSVYGIRLYELLVQWQTKGTREVAVDWLREKWGLRKKYARMKDLKKDVINPAINDINQHSNLWVNFGQRKAGKKIISFQFEFGLKEPSRSKQSKPTRNCIEKNANPGESWEDAKKRLSEMC